ncbi:lysozyme inhibitor LprI family protein [Acetobacter nitrogenifigens]|uniref:lysozyme inhibitor LprI family protein n=1 Tax=Acetobacter nitrogenifigens TaxID=285268 RepID=UPI0013782BAA|nr:lysozyme inhibitor LprI family protein [Acetobacter nitrogenifigens]
MRIIWLATLGAITLPQQVSAASFNCASVMAPKEKLICQDRELSALDERLAHAYKHKLKSLSPYGQGLLKKSEQNWLRYIETVCPITFRSTSDSAADSAKCIKSLYQQRLQDLDAVTRKVGPFVFIQIDSFAAEPYRITQTSRNSIGFYVQHLSRPQIDEPRSTKEVAWNNIYKKNTTKSI